RFGIAALTNRIHIRITGARCCPDLGESSLVVPEADKEAVFQFPGVRYEIQVGGPAGGGDAKGRAAASERGISAWRQANKLESERALSAVSVIDRGNFQVVYRSYQVELQPSRGSSLIVEVRADRRQPICKAFPVRYIIDWRVGPIMPGPPLTQEVAL